MTKQLTLDEMLEILITTNHPTGTGFQSILEATGTAMADTIAKTLGIAAGPATFQGTAFAGTCAPFKPASPNQPCPAPLAPYDPDEGEWVAAGLGPLQKFTVETTYRKSFFRHRIYEAQTPEDACRQALQDHDYEGEQANEQSAGAPRITGVWPGGEPYTSASLPIPPTLNSQSPCNLKIGSEELATVLGALRFWQRMPSEVKHEPPEWDIATNAGTVEPLTSAEIDALCDRLNVS